jgi:hypothetical protein
MINFFKYHTTPETLVGWDHAYHTTDRQGNQVWYRNGRLHREAGPAVVWANGRQAWYRNGVLHRDDGPAVIDPDGTQFWYRNGRLHREDGPAVIWPDGQQAWYRDDQPVDPPNKG